MNISWTTSPPLENQGSHTPTTAVIVAALLKDNVDWAQVRGWEVWKYEADNPDARHRVLENKGNEANVFLT